MENVCIYIIALKRVDQYCLIHSRLSAVVLLNNKKSLLLVSFNKDIYQLNYNIIPCRVYLFIDEILLFSFQHHSRFHFSYYQVEWMTKRRLVKLQKI